MCRWFVVTGKDLIIREIENKSRAIAADPIYPENYLRRAVAFISLDEHEKAKSDLRQFDALATSRDHHVSYEMFRWLKQYYVNEFYDEAGLLAPHAEKLMDRFPADIPSYRDLIGDIVKVNERRDKPEIASRWRAKLQEIGENEE